MRDEEAENGEEGELENALECFFGRPFGFVQGAAGGGVPLDPSFNLSEQDIEENGLRASPTAPNSPEQRGDDDEGETETGHQKERQPKILRGEGPPEKMKSEVQDIDEHGGVSTDRNPREEDENSDEAEHEDFAGNGVKTKDIGGVDKDAGAVLIDRGD